MKKHPHEGRMAEVYVRDPTHSSGLRWIGYTADPVPGGTWLPMGVWVTEGSPPAGIQARETIAQFDYPGREC